VRDTESGNLTGRAQTGCGASGVGLVHAGYALIGAWAAILVLVTAATFLTTAVSFDYVEGVALGHQLMLAAGQPLYGTAIDQPPYSVPLYGPLFYWLNSLLLDPAAPSLSGARGLNLLAALYLGALAIYTARGRLAVGSFAAWLSVLLWLTLEPAAVFLLQNRPDTLALALGASGFVAATSQHRWRTTIAALLLTAAACTKQTAAVAPLVAAILVLLSAQRRQDALGLLVATAAVGLPVLLLLNTLTAGSYWTNAVLANLNGFSPGSALQAWVKVGSQPLFWLGLGLMLSNLRARGPRRDIAIYGLTSLLLHGLAVAKPGANSNYFLEYSWCTAMVLAAVIERLLRPAGRDSRLLTGVVLLASACSLAVATHSVERLRRAAAALPETAEWLSVWHSAVDGPVASMQPGMQLLHGHEPYILDPHIIARLTEQGRFDEGGLLDDLSSGRIAAVIAGDDLSARAGEFSNWSTAVRAAVAKHYEKVDSLGSLSVWLPR